MNKTDSFEVMIAIDHECHEICLIVKADRPILEEEFTEAVLQFYQNSADLDFNNVICDLKDMDKSLN